MKILKILGIILLVIVFIGVGVILLGPSEVHLERQTTINAPRGAVYADVSNMKAFNKWSPWFALDPEARYEWEGPVAGLGAKIVWYSDDSNVGNGSMEIVEASDNGVKYEMIFDEDQDGDLSNNEDNPAYAGMLLSEIEGGTEVTWTFDASNFTGFYKFFALMMESFLGPFYEQGLASLKARVEGRPNFSIGISLEEVDPITYLGVEATSSMDPAKISEAMGDAYGEVMATIVQENIPAADGYPLAVATSYSEESISMICGIPVKEGSASTSSVASVMQTPEGLAVKGLHLGSYESLEDSHNQIDEFVKFYGLEATRMPWEIYITDPGVEPDTAKWVTEVYYPVN